MAWYGAAAKTREFQQTKQYLYVCPPCLINTIPYIPYVCMYLWPAAVALSMSSLGPLVCLVYHGVTTEETTIKDEWKTLNRKNRMYRDMRYFQFAFCLPPSHGKSSSCSDPHAEDLDDRGEKCTGSTWLLKLFPFFSCNDILTHSHTAMMPILNMAWTFCILGSEVDTKV